MKFGKKGVNKVIIEKIIGNVFEINEENLKINWLNMPYDHAHKKIQRFEYEGLDLGLKLSEEDRQRGLKHGDIIYRENNVVYAINIEELECLKLSMDEAKSFVNLAYIIGNRHAKLYWSEDGKSLITPYEKTLEEMLNNVDGIKMDKVMAKLLAKNNLMAILPQGQVVDHHSHDHDHDHDHDHHHHHDHDHHHHHE
ncbi:urease accessory protein UreE [Anaerococcus lactolyticus S7-1-13]|uniref:Urease accessory protein UreE n=1 Tax=Anaerococcus lactolyticus S7-1-13 TaxID=1284686 RepID=A0A095WZI8_9FIRM|nr:urease accessory protein UreE [Anaerococcus lactolyticus S7-1-13]